jgi:hypothetical protein
MEKWRDREIEGWRNGKDETWRDRGMEKGRGAEGGGGESEG